MSNLTPNLTPDSLCQQPRLRKRSWAELNAHELRSVRGYSPDKRDGHDEQDEQDEQDQHDQHDEEQRAQQTFRQRTRDYIADLEERLATQARTSSRKAAKLTSEVQALRRRCQALQRRLDSIGQIAGGSGDNDGTADQIHDNSNNRHDVSNSYGVHDNHATPPSHPSPDTPHQQHSRTLHHSQHSQHSPLQHSQTSHEESSQHPKHPTRSPRDPDLESSPHATHQDSFRDQTPYTVSVIRPKHIPPTCPLDRILLNLLDSRNDMIAHGSPIDTVLGPPKGIVTRFLDQSLAASVHPISRIISEVLSTFPNVALPEQMGMFYKMHLTLRWQISPTPETYSQMPIWLRPTVTQITVPHAAWIDNIPWPGVRDMLINHPDDYPFEVFSEYYSQNVSVNWHFDDSDAVAHESGNIVLHSIFEKHIQKLENWTVSRSFEERFPEMSHFIFGKDPV